LPTPTIQRTDGRLIWLWWAVPIVLALVASAAFYFSPPAQEEKPDKAGLVLCKRFADLKSEANSTANDLLGPATPTPPGAVSEDEAERLDAEALLRGPARITEVRQISRRDPVRFTLALAGSFECPRLQVKTPDGFQPHQRTLLNPDVTVEIRDGKLYPIRAGLHYDGP
jgi:hypothetical protein